MDCFDNKDAMGIGKLYTEDCKIMPPGADCMMGRECKSMQYIIMCSTFGSLAERVCMCVCRGGGVYVF